MRVACSRCDSRYEIPDQKLAGGAVKIRCSRCGHVFVVKKRVEVVPPPEPPPAAGAEGLEDFDFGGFDEAPLGQAPDEAPEPSGGPPEIDLQAPTAPPEEAPAPAGSEGGRFEGLGVAEFDPTALGAAPEEASQPPADSPASGTPTETGDELPSFEDLDLPSLGELDLGDFSLEEDGGPNSDEEFPEAVDEEPAVGAVEKIRREELVSVAPTSRPTPVQGIADEIPNLDLQRGPRRSETPGKPSPVVARDRRRSPLFWIVILAAVATAGWTGYLFSFHREGLTFLNPSAIRDLWRRHEMDARLGLDNLQGYYRSASGGRQFFVIRGEVVNKSGSAQGLIRVKGRIFGPSGKEIASREVYCGNVLTEDELATMSVKDIDARLQNKVGEALSNVDIPASAKVPFMVVFASPPDGVTKYDVSVTEAKAGSGT